MNEQQLLQAFEEAKAAGDFENAYKIEQQIAVLNNSGPMDAVKEVAGEVGRQVGLTGRAIAGGAAQAVEPFTEPVRYLMNKALPGNPIGGIESAADDAMTAAGVPEPQNAVERGVQTAGRFVAGAGMGSGAANKVDDLVMDGVGLARQAAPDAPTAEQLKKLANASYKAADDAGLAVTPNSFKGFVAKVLGTARREGIDKDIHPKATAAVRRLKEAAESGNPQTLQDVDTLRRVVGSAAGAFEEDKGRIGRIIRDQLDNYVDNLGRSDVAVGDAKAGAAALRNARNLWKRMSKTEVVAEAVEKAGIRAGQFSGSGFENALRTQFRQIAMNKKRMRGFSDAEKEAIKKVAMGGPLDNAFRTLGKLAPTGVVSAGFSGGAGYAIGGPVGAVAVPAVGAVGRRVATELTKKNVSNLDDMVRRGAAKPEETAEWLLPWLSGPAIGADTNWD